MIPRSLLALCSILVLACAPRPPVAPPPPVPPPAAPAAPAAKPPPPAIAPPDALVVIPHDFVVALEPWLVHRRAQGRQVEVLELETLGPAPDANAIRLAIEERAKDEHLTSVLLVGDAQRRDESRKNHLPTFYFEKLRYQAPPEVTHDHREEHLFHRSLPRVEHDHQSFPSDQPYALLDRAGVARLEVGRLPARSPEEVSDYVAKVLRYESEPLDRWRRRLVVRAGPARFGAFIDGVIERVALGILDADVPYDFDVDLVFAKPGSPYSHRLDQLGGLLTEQANRGAFLFAYVGHSSPAYFDRVPYRGRRYLIGSRHDFESMRITDGAPIFVALSCDAGAFDMSQGRRSMAEEAVLNPRGAVAAFAASRESHPYPNLLYGEAMVEVLLEGHPTTLGRAFRDVRASMKRRTNLLGERLSNTNTTSLKDEHAALYNLFGDPTLKLRTPAPLVLEAPSTVAPGAPIEIRLPGAPGPITVTLETRRREVRGTLRPADEIDALPLDEAFAAMAENHALANDKVIDRRQVDSATSRVVFEAPTTPGSVVIKAFAAGSKAAWGHAFVTVDAP